MNYNIYYMGPQFTLGKASYDEDSKLLVKYSWNTAYTALGYRGSNITVGTDHPYNITATTIPEYYLEFPTAYDCPPEVIIFNTNKDTGVGIYDTGVYKRWDLKIKKVTSYGVYITDGAYSASSSDNMDWSADGIIYLRVRARTIIHDSTDPDGPKVISPELDMNFGEAGELKFDIYPGDPGYDDLGPYKTHIMVDRNDKPFWYGRVSNIETAFDLKKSVTCEGNLNFLKDVAVGFDSMKYLFDTGWSDDVFVTYDGIFSWAIISYLGSVLVLPEYAGYYPGFLEECRVIFDLPAKSNARTDISGATPYPVGGNRTQDSLWRFRSPDISYMNNISEVGESGWSYYGPGVYVSSSDINYDDRPYDILNTYLTDVFNGYLYTEIDDRGFHRIRFTINPIDTGSQVIEYGENMTDITVKTDATNLLNIWCPYTENPWDDNKEVWFINDKKPVDPTNNNYWDPSLWHYSLYDNNDEYWEYYFASNPDGTGASYNPLRYLYDSYSIYNIESLETYGPLFSVEEAEMQTYSADWQSLLAQTIRALDVKSRLPIGLSVTAVDRAEYDGTQEPLDLGHEYRIISKPHDVDTFLMLTEANLHLDAPRESEFGFGDLDTSASGYMTSRYGKGVNYSKSASSDAYSAIIDTSDVTTQSGTVFIDDLELSGSVIIVFPKEFVLDDGGSISVTVESEETIPGLTLTVSSTSANQFKMGYSSPQSVRSFHVHWVAKKK